MRVWHSQLKSCKENPAFTSPNELRRADSAVDEFAARRPEKRRVHFLQNRQRYIEADDKQEIICDSFMRPSSQPSYRSCIYLLVPLRSASSVVFLDKSLSISLGHLEGGRAAQPCLYRSTLSIRLGASSCRRSSRDVKPAKTDEDYGKSKVTASISKKYNGHETGCKSRCKSPSSRQRGRRVQQVAHAVNSKVDDSDTHCHGSTLGLLSFRGSSPANAKAGRHKENAEEAEETACPAPSYFRYRQRTASTGPVAGRAASDKREERQGSEASSREAGEDAASYEDERRRRHHTRPKVDSPDGAPKTLSLKEALELFRPDFISRSQGRVRRLEQRARRRRRALQDSNPDLVQGLGEDGGKQRRKCTMPDPLSDNLFKPRERSISGREMQLRSRRMYNKLPEVTKKKEQEQKRAVSQTNRLRAEVFKKRLLEQILQR